MYLDAGKTDEFYFFPTVTYESFNTIMGKEKEIQFRFLKFYIGFWWSKISD